MRPPIAGGTILITGASSGIGLEMARLLAPLAKSLILVARRQDRLNILKDELQAKYPMRSVIVKACDLADPLATENMLEQIQSEVGPVEVLINNAGFGDFAFFEQATWDKLEQMIAVNVLALTRITHRLLGPMVRQGRGGILNISSALGLVFMPKMAVYVGTKHYVTSFTEALRLELKGTGVVVSQVCPGPVHTEFHAIAGSPTEEMAPKFVQLTAAQCAEIALTGFSRGKPIIIPGRSIRWISFLGRWSPRPLLRFVYTLAGKRFNLVPNEP